MVGTRDLAPRQVLYKQSTFYQRHPAAVFYNSALDETTGSVTDLEVFDGVLEGVCVVFYNVSQSVDELADLLLSKLCGMLFSEGVVRKIASFLNGAFSWPNNVDFDYITTSRLRRTRRRQGTFPVFFNPDIFETQKVVQAVCRVVNEAAEHVNQPDWQVNPLTEVFWTVSEPVIDSIIDDLVN